MHLLFSPKPSAIKTTGLIAMPITLPIELRPVSQAEFGEIAFGVMNHVFAIHNEFGRFTHEKLVKRELAFRVDEVELEVPIEMSHLDFGKVYYLDVLVKRRVFFESKCVDALHSRNRAQLLSYLILTGPSHGELINTRGEQIEHEFVNCKHYDYAIPEPTYVFADWDRAIPEADRFAALLHESVTERGTGLELNLCQEALAHFLTHWRSTSLAQSGETQRLHPRGPSQRHESCRQSSQCRPASPSLNGDQNHGK